MGGKKTKTKNKIKCACLALACAQAQDDRSASCLYPNMYMYISLLTNLSIQIIDGRAVDTHFALCVCVCVCVCACVVEMERESGGRERAPAQDMRRRIHVRHEAEDTCMRSRAPATS